MDDDSLALVTRLAALDTAAVSDALDQLGLAGVLTGLEALSVPRRIAGRAVTVLLGPPAGAPAGRHLCTAAVEAGGPQSVIVVAHQGRVDCAGWGGILSLAARHRGIAGTVVDGAVRDVDEAVEVDYPVYARSATPRTARGRTQEHSWGEPVEVCGVTVHSGDLVLADRSGVVVVAAAQAEAVLAAAERIVAKEAAMAEAVQRGTPVSAVMGGDYESMLEDRP